MAAEGSEACQVCFLSCACYAATLPSVLSTCFHFVLCHLWPLPFSSVTFIGGRHLCCLMSGLLPARHSSVFSHIARGSLPCFFSKSLIDFIFFVILICSIVPFSFVLLALKIYWRLLSRTGGRARVGPQLPSVVEQRSCGAEPSAQGTALAFAPKLGLRPG